MRIAAVCVLLCLSVTVRADGIDTLITDLTKDRNPAVRLEAVRKIAKMGDGADKAVPALIRAMQQDRHLQVQMVATQTLGQLKLRPKDVIPAIAAEMRKQLRKPDGESKNYGIIQGGLDALRLWGNEAHESLPIAVHCLKDRYKQVRTQAARAVGAIAKTDAEVEQAVKALKVLAENDPEKEVRDAARSAAKTLEKP